jgi:Na+/H+ antiporter NhaD/arsenite permease-like protein
MKVSMNLFGIPAEFFIFGLTLIAIATLHGQALPAALSGLALTLVYKFLVLGLAGGGAWLVVHVAHEWPTLANLLLLLVGFAVLANQFEQSAIPDAMPRFLPDNWTGGLVLLAIVFCMSIFLDNIAAAIIGGVMAKHVYRGKVGIGYLAAIVAASNAGGAGSVIGDTTTTMMWISGVSPLAVLDAFVASGAAFLVFAPLSALQQQRFSPIVKNIPASAQAIDWARGIIVLILLGTILCVNLIGNAFFPGVLDAAPLLGIGLWIAIAATALWRRPQWNVVPSAAKGAVFLIALVATASMMPVERLPAASWQTAFGLGFLSAVFDNIPLTALALRQGGYDWGILAFAVGFGGSMLWFGSSAGVALSGLYPEVRSVGAWVRRGWYVPVAYIVGFFVLLGTLGWRPD